MKFEAGKAYVFKSCLEGAGSFVGVAAIREEDGSMTFVKPADLLNGQPVVIEGREVVFVDAADGLRYMASASCEVSGAVQVLEEIRKSQITRRG